MFQLAQNPVIINNLILIVLRYLISLNKRDVMVKSGKIIHCLLSIFNKSTNQKQDADDNYITIDC